MLSDDVYTFNQNFSFINQHLFYLARLLYVFVITSDNNHLVALADIILWFKSCFHFVSILIPDTARNNLLFICTDMSPACPDLPMANHYSTSGANEIIFI